MAAAARVGHQEQYNADRLLEQLEVNYPMLSGQTKGDLSVLAGDLFIELRKNNGTTMEIFAKLNNRGPRILGITLRYV